MSLHHVIYVSKDGPAIYYSYDYVHGLIHTYNYIM